MRKAMRDVYKRQPLNAVPLDLIGIQMQIETAAVAGVNGRVLRFVGVVDLSLIHIYSAGFRKGLCQRSLSGSIRHTNACREDNFC